MTVYNLAFVFLGEFYQSFKYFELLRKPNSRLERKKFRDENGTLSDVCVCVCVCV